MNKMNCFNEDSTQVTEKSMYDKLGYLVNKEKGTALELLLLGISAKLEKGVVEVKDGKVLSIEPFIELDKAQCGIEFKTFDHNGTSLKKYKLFLIVEGFPPQADLSHTEDFIELGITNADKIIEALNNIFTDIEFMLDEDTNEN